MFLTLAGSCVTAANAQFGLYQIGNSFTWDSQPQRTATMASELGTDVDLGYHIRCGSSATRIVNDPDTTCVAPTSFGKFETALPVNTWDAITIQSFESHDSTLQSETDAIAYLADLAKQNSGAADTDFYIYQSWFFNSASQEANWLSPIESSLQQPVVHRRAYFTRLREELAALGHDFLVVPTGDVLYRVLEEINAGNLEGLTGRGDLFRDSIHMSYSFGRFLASTTVLATVLQTDPTGYDSPWNFDRDLETQLQELVWEVVSNHPQAGIVDSSVVGDFDDNGSVGLEDVSYWQSSFGSASNLTADGNRDFSTNAADYAVWRDSVSQVGVATSVAPAQLVPEPGAGLVLIAVACGCTKRPNRSSGGLRLRHATRPCYRP